jgi:NADH dehydrogenase
MHRGYHVLAVPTWERKVRVLTVWATAVPFGRDIVSLASVQHPREAFLAGAGSRLPPPAEASGARMDVVMAGDAPRS